MADLSRNSLSIRERGWAVPYTPTRPERAFRDLKGHPEQLVDCELDPALRGLVAAVNAPGTGIFTVASAALPTSLGRGHRHSGYVEFTLNSRREVGCAANYFPIFFAFSQLLQAQRLDRAQFHWDLGETEFLDAGVSGFACCVYVKTDFVGSAAMAQDDWDQAMAILAQSLSAYRGSETDPIYEAAQREDRHAACSLILPGSLNLSAKLSG
jgi:hypothetical protein